jgi:magnesium transporter
MNTP